MVDLGGQALTDAMGNAMLPFVYRVLVEVNGPDARVRYPPPPGRRRHVARRGRSGGEEGGVERGERRGRGGHGCCAALRRLRRGWLWLGPEDIPSGRGGAFCTACFPPSFLWLCMTRTHALVGDVASRPATKLGPAAAAPPCPFLCAAARLTPRACGSRGRRRTQRSAADAAPLPARPPLH